VVAGLNAALVSGGGDGVIFDRTESYIGVMIDDLTSRGVTEPYRMFTSRSEFRLSLRIDNADDRLGSLADRTGLIGAARSLRRNERQAAIAAYRKQLEACSLTPDQALKHGLLLKRDGVRRTAFDLLSHPDITMADIQRIWPEFCDVSPQIAERVNSDAVYAVYLERQLSDIEAYRRDQSIMLPTDLDLDAIAGLSNELKARLGQARPETLAQAARMEGMTPAALTLLAVQVKRHRRAHA
jgi:tRNA uridine 5-carboxymethylaminomethyl modification enzyme